MNDNKNSSSSGAPSSDTTSALFVSSRKKQLEQQEAERRAKEKEQQRLDAEAEVTRLEHEVEERRRRAEEEAQRVEADAAERLRQAAVNPNTAAAPPQGGKPVISAAPNAASAAAINAAAGGPAGLFANKKLLALIGGGAAVVIILAVVLIITLGGNPAQKTQDAINSSYFFIEGDPEFMGVFFYTDGKVEYFDREDGITEGTYVIDKKDVIMSFGNLKETLTMIDENTFTSSLYAGVRYLRTDNVDKALFNITDAIVDDAAQDNVQSDPASDTGDPEQDTAQSQPAPKAGDLLNATETLADWGLTISYPSTSFYVADVSESALTFNTRQEGLGQIALIQTDHSYVGLNADQKMELVYQVGSTVFEAILNDYNDGVITSSDAFYENDVLVYEGEGMCVDDTGAAAKVYVRAAVWAKTKTVFVMYAVAANSHYDICKTLTVRMKESVKFE